MALQTVSGVRVVQWLTGGGFGVVALDLVGEYVGMRSAGGLLRRFECSGSASRAALGSAPAGWCREVCAFRPVAGFGVGGAGRRGRGSDSTSNTVRFVSNWDCRTSKGSSRRTPDGVVKS